MKSSIETPEFYDVGRIIDPDSQIGIAFQRHMEELARRIMGAEYNEEKHGDIRYLLSDDNAIGGYVETRAKPMVVVMNKGAILNLPHEDQFASIFAHELAHILAQNLIGDHNNSKVEEGGADDKSAMMLAASGYNLNVVEDMCRHFMESSNYYEYRIISLEGLFRVHPNWPTRLSIVQSARVHSNRSGISSNNPPTYMPEILLNAAMRAKYLSKSDIHARANASSFVNMSYADKLKWLVKTTQDLPPNRAMEKGITEHSNFIYTDQIAAIFGKISPGLASKEQKAAYENAFNQLMQTGQWTGDRAADFCKNTGKGLCDTEAHSEHDIKPIGFLKEMSLAAENFISAPTPEAAKEHAQKLISIYLDYKTCLSKDFYNKECLKRHLPLEIPMTKEASQIEEELSNNGYAEAPLLRQHIWATRDGIDEIGSALLILIGGNYLDMNDGRKINKYLDFCLAEPRLYAESTPDLSKYSLEYYITDGRITGIKKKPVKFSFYNRYPRSAKEALNITKKVIRQRLEWENNLLKDGVDWNMLLDDPKGFMYIYREAVNPLLTSLPCGYPFAEAMMDFFHQQAALNPKRVTNEERLRLMGIFVQSFWRNPVAYSFFEHDTKTKNIFCGMDQDHPIIREYWSIIKNRFPTKPTSQQELDELNRYLSYNAYTENIRLNPLEPITGFAATLHAWYEHWDFNERRFYNDINPIGKAYLVKEIQKISEMKAQEQDLLKLITCQNAISSYQALYGITKENQKYAKQLATRLEKQILDALDLAKNNTPVETLIEWQIKGRENIRISPTMNAQELWDQIIIDKIRQQTPPEKKSELLGKYLGSHPTPYAKHRYRYRYQPPSTHIRIEASELIIEDISRGIGRDDGSSEYAHTVIERLDKHLSSLKGRIISDVVKGIAPHIQAQPHLAYRLEHIWKQHAAEDAIRSELNSRALEAVMLGTSRDMELKAGLFEFLSRPLSEKSLKRAQLTLDINPDSTRGLIEEDKQNAFLRHLHTELWSSEMPMRALFFKEILFPHDIDQKTAQHISHSLIDRIIGDAGNQPFTAKELDPFNNKTKTHEAVASTKDYLKSAKHVLSSAWKRASEQFGLRPKRDSKEAAKLIVDSYLKIVSNQDPIEARFLISALIAAEHIRSEGQPLGLGETLYTVLSHMGPAGANLIQAIHNHPSTPPDIRQGLEKGKTQHDQPLWWDIIKQMEEEGLLAPDKTKRIGSLLGCGKFGITMLNETPNGRMVADTLLRKNAWKITEREFTFMEQAAQIVAESDIRMKPIIGMIQQARHSAHIETNMQLAIKQNDLAKQVYDGITATVKTDNGDVFLTHIVMDITETGIGYKRAQPANGDHFLDLQDDSEAKWAGALAGLATQLSLRLAGLPVERDRHGGNTKQEDASINHFDTAMMDLRFPTEQEKNDLGKLLAKSVKSSIVRGNFIDYLTDGLEEEASNNPFFARIRQEILGCGDYIKSIIHRSEEASRDIFAGILGNALFGASADDTIRESFEKEMGLLNRKTKAYFTNAAEKCPVQINNIINPAMIVLPQLTDEEAKLIEGVLPVSENTSHTDKQKRPTVKARSTTHHPNTSRAFAYH